jgi:hypothetical protein
LSLDDVVEEDDEDGLGVEGASPGLLVSVLGVEVLEAALSAVFAADGVSDSDGRAPFRA